MPGRMVQIIGSVWVEDAQIEAARVNEEINVRLTAKVQIRGDEQDVKTRGERGFMRLVAVGLAR